VRLHILAFLVFGLWTLIFGLPQTLVEPINRRWLFSKTKAQRSKTVFRWSLFDSFEFGI